MMVTQHIPVVTLLLVFLLQIFGQVIYKVHCDYTTPNCECPFQFENETAIEVCEFQFRITLQHTFTRYRVNTNNQVDYVGHVWIINNETGEFEPHPDGLNCDASVPINSTECTEPFTVDGYTFKSFIAINRRIPGPTLIVHYNQIINVNVYNGLIDDIVSIHWHGMEQRKTNFMDGAEHVTQCGAAPQSSFRYIFRAANTGTFWYHSHSGAQRNEGVFGSLIIKESPDLITRAQEQVGEFEDQPDKHTLIFLDWQFKSSTELLVELQADVKYYHTNKVPTPTDRQFVFTSSQDGTPIGTISYWSGLINGKGRYDKVDYIQSRLSIFTVSPSKCYRFRLIGAQFMYAYRVSIAGHKLKVLALDGTFVKPIEVDFIIIQSGERYDFLLETKSNDEISAEGSSYPIWGRTLETSIPEAHIVEAILHYDTTPEPDSTEYENIFNSYSAGNETCTSDNSCETNYVNTKCTPDYTCLALNCPFKNYPSTFYIQCIHINKLELLFPLNENELPDVQVNAEDTIILNFAIGGSFKGVVNARSNVLPSSPLTLLNSSGLAAIEENEFCKLLNSSQCEDNIALSAANPACVCTHVIKIQYNRSIQMVFSAVGADLNPLTTREIWSQPHPIHFHGHQFHVVDIQFGEYNELGQLIKANDSIKCGGASTTACANPSWADGKDYSIGKSGKISSTAPRKDTVFLPAGGHVVVYFKSDNPGYWFLHCHIAEHLLAGMAVIIDEAEDQHIPAPSGMDTCGNFDWTIQDFFKAVDVTYQDSEKDDSDIDKVALGLGVGLGNGLLLSLMANVIFFILFLYCCCIKHDSNKMSGA